MDTLPPSMRELARRLITGTPRVAEAPSPTGALVNDSLQKILTQLTGTDGFVSLLRRAMALASVEVPALHGIKVGAHGHLEGIQDLDVLAGRAQEQAAIAVTAQMLELLVTFIGEQLTRRLVREASPETSPKE